ncbi:MAG TPA: hypothetical protein VHI11_07760 [Jiangellaceae bacterium]|jgi:hypothetical protein|nr:hypothetical protein [Jiangellaceae bacterium]
MPRLERGPTLPSGITTLADKGTAMALDWKVVHGGKTPPPGEVVRPDERLSWGRTVGLGAQHVVAGQGAELPGYVGVIRRRRHRNPGSGR